MIPSTETLLAHAYDECIRLSAQCLRLETENTNLRGRIHAVREVLRDVTEPETDSPAGQLDTASFDHGVDVVKNLIELVL